MSTEKLLELDAIGKTVTFRNVTKNIPENHWSDVISPFLYPEWDSDRDKLVTFSWYSDNTYFCQKRKYVKNFSTGEYIWRDYEFEMLEIDNLTKGLPLFEKLKETFFLIDSLENTEYENEFAKIRAKTRSVNWLTVRLARNFLLDETDHVFIEDSPYSDEDKSLYRLYRQKLREIPQDTLDGEAATVKFPVNPRYFKDIFLAKDETLEYLSTPDQFIELAPHYLSTFREKFASYLIVKNTSEGLYIDTFMDALKSSGVVYDGTSLPSNTDAVGASNYLRNLLERIESEMESGDA